jgi:hypothetical protein
MEEQLVVKKERRAMSRLQYFMDTNHVGDDQYIANLS